MINDDVRIVNKAPSQGFRPQADRHLIVNLCTRSAEVLWNRDCASPVHAIDTFQHIDITGRAKADVVVADDAPPARHDPDALGGRWAFSVVTPDGITSTDGTDRRVTERLQEALDPVGPRDGIVVGKRDERRMGRREADGHCGHHPRAFNGNYRWSQRKCARQTRRRKFVPYAPHYDRRLWSTSLVAQTGEAADE